MFWAIAIIVILYLAGTAWTFHRWMKGWIDPEKTKMDIAFAMLLALLFWIPMTIVGA
jgi:hypothetical protein